MVKSQYPRRTIGWLGTTFSGGFVGANAGAFVLAMFLSTQGTSAAFYYLFGLLAAWLCAPAFLELVLMYPNKVGGIGAACSEAFRPYNPIVGNIAGTCYVIGWITTTSFGDTTLSSIVHQMILPGISVEWIGTFIILGCTLLSLCGLYWVTAFSIPCGLIAAALTIIAVIMPVMLGTVDWQHATDFHLKTPFPGVFGTFTGIMAGIYLITWLGPPIAEGALCFVGETKNPGRNVPLGLLFSLLFGVLYYFICPTIWLGTLGLDNLLKDQLGNELVSIYAPLFGGLAKLAGLFFVIFNYLLWIIAPLATLPRVLSQLSKDGLLPKFIGLENKKHVPWVGTCFYAGISTLMVWGGSPSWMLPASNYNQLLAYFLVGVAVWLLRRDQPDAPRLYRAPTGFIAIALLLGISWIIVTVFGFQQYGLTAMIIGIAVSFSGVPLYFWRKIADRYEAGLHQNFRSIHVKLTGAMFAVLVLDAIGYLIAVHNVSKENLELIVMLEDIFVIVAMLTIGIGIVLPGMIAVSADHLRVAAKKLAQGTLKEFSDAMHALGAGNLDAAHASTNITLIPIYSNDEIGDMTKSFNLMQQEVQRSAIGLNQAREGLREAKRKILAANQELLLLNESLENKVRERTNQLELTNQQLNQEFVEHKKTSEKFVQLHQEMLIASRQAGMAEIATSVLHNIGNVVTSMTTTTSLLKEKIKTTKVDKLLALAEMLEQHQHDIINFLTVDPNGQHVIEFIITMANVWKDEKEILMKEISELNDTVDYVRSIIAKQQSFSTAISMIEETSITTLLENAVSLNRAIYENIKLEIEIVYDNHLTESVLIDRIKVLQILVNLIKNAFEALIASENKNKRIILRTKELSPDTFLIQIIDNGIGITIDNLQQIFTYGFTTKKDGHGFGLHMSILSAREVGGDLTVESEGVGKGAIFNLMLPFQLKKSKT
jgi:signal transduction histidine kinase